MLERLRALGGRRVPPAQEGTPTTEIAAEVDRTTVEPDRFERSAPADDRDNGKYLERPTVKDLNRATVKDMPSGDGATSPLERISRDFTPAPLPSPPGAEQAEEVLFESVPTSPAGAPDLAALGLGSDSDYSSIPGARGRARPDLTTARGYLKPRAPTRLDEPWVLPALLAATSLAVGMVIGALLFSGDDSSASAALAGDAGMCVCPDPGTAAADPPSE